MNIKRSELICHILSAIGMQELSLTHLCNAEAERLYHVLGEFKTLSKPCAVESIIKANRLTPKMLQDGVKAQMLFNKQLEEILQLLRNESNAFECPTMLKKEGNLASPLLK